MPVIKPRIGLRERVHQIIAGMPLEQRTGRGSTNRIVAALRNAGFEVRTSVQRIDVKRPGGRYVFFRYPKREF